MTFEEWYCDYYGCDQINDIMWSCDDVIALEACWRVARAAKPKPAFETDEAYFATLKNEDEE